MAEVTPTVPGHGGGTRGTDPPPPPLEQAFDVGVTPASYGQGMGGGDHSNEHDRWLRAFVATAWLADDDPALCVELVRQLRIVGDGLGLSQGFQQRQHNALRLVGEVGIGQDELLEGGVGGHADRDVAQVSGQMTGFDVA